MAHDEKKISREEQEVIALEARRIEAESRLAQLKLQMAELELEDLTARVEERREKKAALEARAAAAQRSLEQANADIIASQKVCRHKKGGRNKAGLVNGSDNYYSVNKHTYSHGETVVFCTRCTQEWRMPKQPNPELKKQDPAAWKLAVAEFKKQLAEYREALNWPTDNEPSGTALFTFGKMDPATAAELAL